MDTVVRTATAGFELFGVPCILWFYPHLYRPYLLSRLQCFCAIDEGFVDNYGMSDQSGLLSMCLRTGDPSTACRGRDVISVYHKTKYAFVGCFQDDLKSRIMRLKGREPVTSVEVSWDWSIRGGLKTGTHLL